MPLTHINSYLPTLNEFIAHWAQVNAALPSDLVVKTPDQTVTTRADFIALRETLKTQFQDLIGHLNEKETIRGGIRIDKTGILAHFNEFNALLDSYWICTPFIRARAKAPSHRDGEVKFLTPMHYTYFLWGKLNTAPAPSGLTLPLVLSDGTTVEDFASEIASLRTAHVAEAAANQDAVLARGARDATLAKARAILLAYRKVVPARCAPYPALLQCLPTLTPPPGHTPAPVNARATFQAPDQAKIVHDSSAEPTLARYELRGNPGEGYEEKDAVIIASHDPGELNEFTTGFSLTQPGTQASFKVFVVLETGNEAGSASMTVERTG